MGIGPHLWVRAMWVPFVGVRSLLLIVTQYLYTEHVGKYIEKHIGFLLEDYYKPDPDDCRNLVTPQTVIDQYPT